MCRGSFRDLRMTHRLLQMIAFVFLSLGHQSQRRGREKLLPDQLPGGVLIFSIQLVRQKRARIPAFMSSSLPGLAGIVAEVCKERRLRGLKRVKRRSPGMARLSVRFNPLSVEGWSGLQRTTLTHRLHLRSSLPISGSNMSRLRSVQSRTTKKRGDPQGLARAGRVCLQRLDLQSLGPSKAGAGLHALKNLCSGFNLSSRRIDCLTQKARVTVCDEARARG